MGQDHSQQDIELKYATTDRVSKTHTPNKIKPPVFKNIRVQCDGVLTLRSTPFKNSIEIQKDSQLLFLQNGQSTLKQLLENRLNTNKLFLLQDIEKLIQSTTFTLAYLQQKGIIYKNISPQHIYYSQNTFKLLPNELIEQSTYQQSKTDNEIYPSPQQIIGLKYGEQDIIDEDILQKSNVFSLGLVILEVTSLLSSFDCFNIEECFIDDDVINDRIILVEEYYGSKIARIIANMLDYDYTERMNMKQISIWVNRQLEDQNKIDIQGQSRLMQSIMSKSDKQVSSTSICQDKTGRKLAKNNSVYMQMRKDYEHQNDRNRIYVQQNPKPQISIPRIYQQTWQNGLKRNQSYTQKKIERSQKSLANTHSHLGEGDSFKFGQVYKHQLKHHNPYCQDIKYGVVHQEQHQNTYIKDVLAKTGKKTNPYRHQYLENQIDSRQITPQVYQSPKQPLREVSNQYYPRIEERMRLKNEQNMEAKRQMGDSGALNRIKEEILKSRKLIEEFKRSEGLKF